MATESEENGTEMQPEVEDSSYSLARLKLENLLNKSMTIRMTDGRTLVGLFLCTDRDCNVILGSAQEFLKSTGFKENATCSRASYLRDSSSRFCTNCLNPYTQNIYCTDYKPLRCRTRIRLELPDQIGHNFGFRRPLH
ncbi:N-alpha-acetyltransferase 38, NatC auxiliary subunit isoform X2 [Paramisgurnus dabryanus]|uniref:N-alpha-acetyltransferase 38, NatC auxiliary subunit isoform X2 n=1 Tax=Paramisgurnus dabryanus TaxID=90735 RepID=UPI0031F3716C